MCSECEALDLPMSSEYVRRERLKSQLEMAKRDPESAAKIRRELAECEAVIADLRRIRDAHYATAHQEESKKWWLGVTA